MKHPHENAGDREMAQYLLGNLAEVEQERLEETLLVDENAFARLEAVEDDLIDAYARGELSSAEQKKFQQRFLSTQGRRQRVAFGRALAWEVSQQESASGGGSLHSSAAGSRGWPLRLALAANIVLALGLAWLATQTWNLRGQVEDLASQRLEAVQEKDGLAGENQGLAQQLAQRQATSEELDRTVRRQSEELGRKSEEIAALRGDLASRTSTKRAAQPLVASILLSIGVRSEGGSAALKVPSAADQIELQVDLDGDDDYEDYRVTLRTSSGSQVWSRKGVTAVATDWGSELVLRLPAKLLEAGRYELAVEGLAASGDVLPVGFYGFSIEK